MTKSGDSQWGEDVRPSLLTRAAVLVPLFRTPGCTRVVLIRRTTSLPNHRGQIAFPGGRFDPERDESLLASALREAQEEVGLDPAAVSIVGALPEVRTLSSGFLISPFVGLVPPAYDYHPFAAEVAAVFSMPLRARTDPAHQTEVQWTYGGRVCRVPAIRYRNHVVWGATLRILDLLLASSLVPGESRDDGPQPGKRKTGAGA